MYRLVLALFVNIAIPAGAGFVPQSIWAVFVPPPWSPWWEDSHLMVGIFWLGSLWLSGGLTGILGLSFLARALPVILSFWVGATLGVEFISQMYPGDLWHISAPDIAVAFVFGVAPLTLEFVVCRRRAQKQRSSAASSSSALDDGEPR